MLVAPSVLSLDYSQFETQIAILNQEVKWLHFDVMDGHFVPNLSFGPDILKAFKKASELFLDVHLMVDDPDFFLDPFYRSGASGITFHYEAMKSDEAINQLIDRIHALGLKAGISIKPKTDVKVLELFLAKLDLVLIMSVEPGFGGQSFIESAYDKIAHLNSVKANYNFLIEVDGGVSDQNSAKLKALGADVIVAGSFVFKGDIRQNIAALNKD